ncbi:MAG: oxygen-dependent coproporphyrinogen oxidase [Candidatus Paracaedibacteraceae bacterium]|nr:oxygen-dependent coproporphyrinogen oxidase [Candidatus Paracaedibacteraceae bacterium]
MKLNDGAVPLELKETTKNWFVKLQKHICAVLEEIENEFQHQTHLPGRFSCKPWKRIDLTQPNQEGGGGIMGILENGAVFEKAGVNTSTVYGEFSKEFCHEIPGADKDPKFWASGISFVAHPMNPFVPAVHFNTRHILTSKGWFGGGADLTPTFAFDEDTKDFHDALRQSCDQYHPDAYAKYKLWCDEYFYIPHRKEMRGVGGIFFDYINSGDTQGDFDFLKALGMSFINAYAMIVRRRMHEKWTAEDKYKQLIKRGRYAEFNLLYDRGTRFGLMTNGNVEAILMSLPPVAAWI